MIVDNFSILECDVLNLINKGFKKYDDLLEHTQLSNTSLMSILEGLVSKNILVFNKIRNLYDYDSPIQGENIILDGNLLLPVSVLRDTDKGVMYISRGKWYELPIDFDLRRIIWNVKIDQKTNSTLVDIIRSSLLKEKKSRIQQLPEYESLRKRIIPYCEKYDLTLNTIGEKITDVTIKFKIPIKIDGDITIEHKSFQIRTEISTEEFIVEMKKSKTERDWTKIQLNKIFNFTDFIFSQNEVPINLIDNVLSYVKIQSNRKGFTLTYYTVNSIGTIKRQSEEEFENPNEALEILKDIFAGMPTQILIENGFNIEFTE
jgi:hypothetical protein